MPPKLWIGAFELLMLVCKLWKVNSFPLIHVNSIFEPYRLCNMPFLMSVVQFFFHSVVSAYVCVMLWCHSKWVFVLVNFWWPTCNVQCIFGFYKDHLLSKYPISSCMQLMSRFSGYHFSVMDGMAQKVNRSKSLINPRGRTVRAKLISLLQLKNLVDLHGIHRYTTAEAGVYSALMGTGQPNKNNLYPKTVVSILHRSNVTISFRPVFSRPSAWKCEVLGRPM